jgi:7-cyano-7-deazaguanine synthase
MKDKVIVLLSGGLDSTVLLYWLTKRMNKEVTAMFIDYDQEYLDQEIESVKANIDKLKDDGFDVNLWHETLMELPPEDEEYVAARNLILISYAVRLADQTGIREIYVGFIDTEEVERFWDATTDFVCALNIALRPIGVKIEAPFMYFTKKQIIELGEELGVLLSKTWSCNFPTEDGRPCGECAECKKRQKHFI